MLKSRDLANDLDFKNKVERLLPAWGMELKKTPTDAARPSTWGKRKRHADQLIEYPQNMATRYVNCIVLEESISSESTDEEIFDAIKKVTDALAEVEEGEN